MNPTPDATAAEPLLLAHLPPGARRVLEIAPMLGALGARYRALWPDAEWHTLDRLPDAHPYEPYDCVVVDSRARALRDAPAALLDALHEWTTPNAKLVCAWPNMGHIAVVQRLVMGDFSYDGDGLLDAAHARFFTPPSAFKLLLDAGWLPDLRAQQRTDVPESVFSARLIAAAMALGLPRQTAQRNLGLQTMVLVCDKVALQPPTAQTRYAGLSVIVPVNRPLELALNTERSRGLREVDAQVIPVVGARSAADAFQRGAQQAVHPWRLFVHQDVYFPAGTGFMIAERLAALHADGRHGAPVGFAGLHGERGPGGPVRCAGQVVDRTQLFDHPGTSSAVSIDEFAIALHADSPLAPDPSLGWHLWATDLCLQALERGGAPCGEILRVPLFHNSTTGYTLPVEFHDSAQVLLDKYPDLPRVPTLCGRIERTPQAAAA